MQMPTLPLLPSSLTPAMIREAILPMKFTAMQKAVEECCDPYILKTYSQVLDGLAAAARIIKREVPEEVEKLKTISRNAHIRMGELLLEYSNVSRPCGYGRGTKPSERGKIAKDLEINKNTLYVVTRLARGNEEARQLYRESPKSATNFIKSKEGRKSLPSSGRAPKAFSSENVRAVLAPGSGGEGLNTIRRLCRKITNDMVLGLSPSEKSLVRGVLGEIDHELTRIRESLDGR